MSESSIAIDSPSRTLTRRQKALLEELEEMLSLAGLDPQNVIESDLRPDFVTIIIDKTKIDAARAALVLEYTFLDELLASIAARYFFPARRFNELWRTKRFRNFNYFILERLNLIQKLDLADAIRPLGRETKAYVQSINQIRNALAHAFFPENLRGSRTQYKGVDVLTPKGLSLLFDDRDNPIDELFRRAFGVPRTRKSRRT